MKKIIESAIIALLCVACSGNQPKQSFLETEITSANSKLYNADLMIMYCSKMIYVKSKLLLMAAGPYRENVVLNANDGQELCYIGRRGQGPGEYNHPLFVGFSQNADSTYILDFATGNLLKYYTDFRSDSCFSLFSNSVIPDKSCIYECFMLLSNGYYVGLPHYRAANGKIFDLLDSELNIITQFGEPPIMLKDDNDFTKVFDNARLTVYQNKIFLALSSFGFIAGYEIADDVTINTLFENTVVEPSYSSTYGYIVFDKENNLEGFYDIAASGSYIFTTYGGKSRKNLKPDGTGMEPETFAVFDLKGHLISRVKMNHKGARICISDDGETLYHCVRNPEFDIAAYSVKELVK